jgi:hypothetical protein
VDPRSLWAVARGPCVLRTDKHNMRKERTVPLRLGLATYCTLAGFFGCLRGMCEKRHAERVSTERYVLSFGIEFTRLGEMWLKADKMVQSGRR